MASITTYAAGALPRTGDYVRSTHPNGPRHALTVFGITRWSILLIEDITGRVHRIPARQLDLIRRGDQAETPAHVRARAVAA